MNEAAVVIGRYLNFFNGDHARPYDHKPGA